MKIARLLFSAIISVISLQLHAYERVDADELYKYRSGEDIFEIDDQMYFVDDSMFISANGAMIACCANGVYYQNVPSNVIDKIKSLSYIPKVVKFTDDGLYLITDGESAYTYFL